MSIVSTVTPVSTSAITAVVTATNWTEVLMEPQTGATVYFGGAAVTSSDGFALTTASHLPMTLTLQAGEVLYAVASSSASVSVLKHTPF